MKKFKNRSNSGIALLAGITALTVALIWCNSCLSREVSGAQSGALTRFLQAILDPAGRISEDSFHHFIRKAAHFAEFLLLGVFVAGLFSALRQRTGKQYCSLPILLVLLVAVADEYIQFFTDRGSAVTDVILDFAGALTGLACVAFMTHILRRRSAKK